MADAQAQDVIVIGAGMGGSILAAQCGRAGLRTLVLEKGSTPKSVPPRKSLVDKLIGKYDAKGGERWPSELLMRRKPNSRVRVANPILGIGPGGSARIYGAALGRAQREDFEHDFQPQGWLETETERALPNSWPVTYEELLPYYREAEELLGLVGTHDPLDPDDDAPLGTPPPLSPAHQTLVKRLEANGRHPYRMRVGIAYKPGCNECQGVTCQRDCKAHGFNRALLPAIERQAPVSVALGVTIENAQRRAQGEWCITYRDETGDECMVSAPRLVLAAGALNTPRILQAFPSLTGGRVPQMVGRGIMFHAGEMFAVAPPADADLYGQRKVLAFRDHYMDDGVPLAECQSLGMVAKAGMITDFVVDRARLAGLDLGRLGRLVMRPVGIIAEQRFQGQELFTAAVQDLPYLDNFVSSEQDQDGNNRIAITYRVRKEMKVRMKRFRALMKEAFAPLPVWFLTPPGEPNLGHPMGSCRMGGDPEHSVVDGFGQVWGQEGLYIADASVFASSLGINPALTVAALALRTAQRVIGEWEG